MISALELSLTTGDAISIGPFFRGLGVIQAQAAQLRHVLVSYGITLKKAAPAKRPFKYGICTSRVWARETARSVLLRYVKPAFIALLEGFTIRSGDLLAFGLCSLESGISALKTIEGGGSMNVPIFADGLSKSEKEDVLKAEGLAVLTFLNELNKK